MADGWPGPGACGRRRSSCPRCWTGRAAAGRADAGLTAPGGRRGRPAGPVAGRAQPGLGVRDELAREAERAGAGPVMAARRRPAQRRDYLASLLAADPDAARELIRAGWDAAPARERLGFLSVLAGPARSRRRAAAGRRPGRPVADVRARAAYLLARLPGSALGRRMARRALRCVRIEPGACGPRLAVTLAGRARRGSMGATGFRLASAPRLAAARPEPASCTRSWPGPRCAPGRRVRPDRGAARRPARG